jgi:hypothetical protein
LVVVVLEREGPSRFSGVLRGFIAPDGLPTFSLLERIFIRADDATIFDTEPLRSLRDLVVPISAHAQIAERVTARPMSGHTHVHTPL